MASTDAKPVPQKNVAYRITFPILDADGDLVTGATGLDSEVSKDGGTFADCTNEATEIAPSSGVYYLDLTSTEMNADTVAIIVKTSTTGAKTTTIVLYPEEAGDIRVNVTAYGGTAGTFSGGRPEVNTTHAAGTAWGSGAITAASIAADAITAAKIADGAIDANTFAAGAITASAIAADAIGASELAADAVAEIADAVWDEARAGHVAAGSFGEGVASVQGSVTGSVASVSGAVGSVTGAVGSVTGNVGGNVVGSVGSVTAGVTLAADSITSTALAASAVSEIQSGLSTLDAAGVRAALGLASANLDTQLGTLATAAALSTVSGNVSAVKVKTDSLTFTVAGEVNANTRYIKGTAVTGSGTSGDPWGP